MIQVPSALSTVVNAAARMERSWFSWVSQVTDVVNYDYGSGTTADRPNVTAAGSRYFDTTLGLPIWWDGAAWILADGSPA